MELYNTEHNFFAICTFSLLLLTTSIVFFQMAESRKDLPFFFSSLFSIGLVFISFIYTIMALYQYHERMKRHKDTDSFVGKEKLYWTFYLVFGIIFLIIEVFICLVLFGKIERLNLFGLKKNKK